MESSPDEDSLCSMLKMLDIVEKEKLAFDQQLAAFPHSFQLQNQENISRNQIKRLESGLQSALSVDYHTVLETARARNLLSFALYYLGNVQDALQQLNLVSELHDQHNNLVTLANRAVILWQNGDRPNAQRQVAALQQIERDQEEFQYLLIKAKAELAFSYTRLGPRFFSLAISTFQEVIPAAKHGPEKWLWKFGLCLTRRRLLRAQSQTTWALTVNDAFAGQKDLLQALLEIIKNSPSDHLRAKTYAELATFLFMVSRAPDRKQFYTIARITPEEACEKALELDNKDNSVLCKCGRIYRYVRKSERSCELLKKALSIRPSSTGYHHLGLTYKTLATAEKHKDKVKVPGLYRQLSAGARSYQALTQQFGRSLSLEQSLYPDGARSESRVTGERSPTEGCYPLSLNRDVRIVQRMIKSPPSKGVTSFSRQDKFIQEALDNLEKAVDFSREENTRAMYDLALLLKALKELEDADRYLQIMLRNQQNMFGFELINVYEQLGLIANERAAEELEDAQREEKRQEAKSWLLLALKTASELCSKSTGVQDHIGQVWQSFSTLLLEVEKSHVHQQEKIQEKVKLFQLINDHKRSLDLLQQLEQMDPHQTENPEYLKLRIVHYTQTEQYEEALTFMSLLECTAQADDTKRLLEDEHFQRKTLLKAAKQALLQGSAKAKSYFRALLDKTLLGKYGLSDSSSEESDWSGGQEESWDMMVLYDESMQTKAQALINNLCSMCGMVVPILDRDLPANKPYLHSVFHMMHRSRMLVVLTGNKQIPRELRLFMDKAAKRSTTVTLLVDPQHVPKVLTTHRAKLCPVQLLTDDSPTDHCKISAICQVFSFLVNLD